MITVTPQSTIHLCKTKLVNDYLHQLTFASREAQANYFNSKKFRSFADYTYVKKDNTIKVNAAIDEIITCDYLFYTNPGFSNKTYYCFITNMRYVNENVTEITFETDCWQTWEFDLDTSARVFVEREHVSDDSIGAHTIPENLEYGEEYIANSVNNISLGDMMLVMMVSDFPSGWRKPTARRMYNGVYSGCWYLVFPTVKAGTDNLESIISAFDDNAKADAITGLFYAPKSWMGETTSWTFTDQYGCEIMNPSDGPYSIADTTFNRPATLQGYTPRNKKLYVKPYNYCFVTNNSGSDIAFAWEDFAGGNAAFSIKGALTPSCSIKLYPRYYKNTGNGTDMFNYGITGPKLPMCSWQCDLYTNWQAQNGVNNTVQTIAGIAQGVVGAAGSIAMGNPAGLIGSLAGSISSVANTMNQQHIASLTPDQARGNTNSGDITFASGKSVFTATAMSIKAEYAAAIDSFFDMFGYKVTQVKTPNLYNRRNWNYIKTLGCDFDGDIPPEDLNVIRSAFDKGITLWHNPETMLDYSQNNDII